MDSLKKALKKEKMTNEPHQSRIRRRLHKTGSPKVHDYLKNRVGNVSRFLDALTRGAISGIQPVIFIFMKNRMDRAGIEPAASSCQGATPFTASD
jgi:hypothetical protein